MRVGGTEAIKQAVAAGLGLAIVSRAAAADQLALGRTRDSYRRRARHPSNADANSSLRGRTLTALTERSTVPRAR